MYGENLRIFRSAARHNTSCSIANKNKVRSVKSGEHIDEKVDGPYRGLLHPFLVIFTLLLQDLKFNFSFTMGPLCLRVLNYQFLKRRVQKEN